MKNNLFKKISFAVLTATIFNFYTVTAKTIAASHWFNPETGQNVFLYADLHKLNSEEQFNYLNEKIEKIKRKKPLTILVENFSDNPNKATKELTKVLNNLINSSIDPKKELFSSFDLYMNKEFSNNINIKAIETRSLYRLLTNFTVIHNDIGLKSKFEKLYNELKSLSDKTSIEKIIQGQRAFFGKKIEQINDKTINISKIKIEKLIKIINEAKDNFENEIKNYYDENKDVNIKKSCFNLFSNIGKEKYKEVLSNLVAKLSDSIEIKFLIEILKSNSDVSIFAGVFHTLRIEDYLKFLGFESKKYTNYEFEYLYRSKINLDNEIKKDLFNDLIKKNHIITILKIENTISNIKNKTIFEAYDWMFEEN
ncbi:hypothetical protein KJ644_03285 [Candidatus Dependentiae bacterium]|nr:hypothetical protein [Candidatus Dependentiae bacterium]MBU4387470.1 hypothetical protein [Candidatus Dependentiae bacterium]MCG2756149.1 hypothetical protein [Candidatus Dependentiae bacterium]